MTRSLIALIALAAAVPAAAQQHDIIRDRHPFIGGLITVDVRVHSPGRLSIIRGRPGVVMVTGRVADGIATSALDDRGRLTLDAAGDGEVSYVVAVPTGVRIRVSLPEGGDTPALGARSSGARYRWGASAETRAEPDPVGAALMAPPPDDPMGPSLFTVYYSPAAPREVFLPDPSTVRSVAVRFEGDDFRIGASRPFSVKPGATERVEIRPADPPMDIVLVLPLATRDFTLALGDVFPLLVRGGDTGVFCSPSVRQRLSDGRLVFTFNVAGQTLRCTQPPDPRHKG